MVIPLAASLNFSIDTHKNPLTKILKATQKTLDNAGIFWYAIENVF